MSRAVTSLEKTYHVSGDQTLPLPFSTARLHTGVTHTATYMQPWDFWGPNQQLKPTSKGLSGWRKKKMRSVCTEQKKEKDRLSHAKLELKRNVNRNPELRQFQFGSHSFLHVTRQLPKQESFFQQA